MERTPPSTRAEWKANPGDNLGAAVCRLIGAGMANRSETRGRCCAPRRPGESISPCRGVPGDPVKAPDLDPIDLDQIGSYWGVQDDQLSCRMLRVMLLGAVARIFEPGTKFDTMVVFKGEQGKGKSTSLRKLFGPQLLVDTQQPKHKDQILVLHRCWCYEAAELDYMTSRKESGLIKGLLSSAVDTFLAPYGRFIEAHPRRSIMVGTCNRDDFLRMPPVTGASLSLRLARSIVIGLRLIATASGVLLFGPIRRGILRSCQQKIRKPATSGTRASNWRTRSRQPLATGSALATAAISSPSMSA